VVHEKHQLDKNTTGIPALKSPMSPKGGNFSPVNLGPAGGSNQAKSPMFRLKTNSPNKNDRHFKLNLQSI
jgi:hypothetical protein